MGVTLGYIFDSGTGCAAPTGGSAISRPLGALALAALALTLLPGATPTGGLEVNMVKLRSAKGVLRLCLTRDPDNFPSCVDDARAFTATVPASAATARFEGLAPGSYALAVIHDENRNAKLDTMLGIPREGFGFSNNPVIGFGPPRFAAARFAVAGETTRESVRIRYLL